MPPRAKDAKPARIPAERARQLAGGALVASGLAAEKAGAVADVLVEAELAGRATHGLIRVPSLCGSVGKAERGEPEVVRDGAAWALIDGAGELGYLTASSAVDLACEKAQAFGVGIVGVRNTTHAGFMGYYVRRAAARGVIGAITADTFPRLAPTGSTEALLGTNPLAVAFPARPDPIVVDLSTAAVTNGQLMMLGALGTQLPPGLAFGADGGPTTDPAEALAGAVVPFGGPKGYCLALVVQLLSSALVGADVIPERGGNYGVFAAALDPGIFTSREEFAAGTGGLYRRMKGLRTASAEAEVLLPGERAAAERRMRLTDGIELPAELLQRIEELGAGPPQAG